MTSYVLSPQPFCKPLCGPIALTRVCDEKLSGFNSLDSPAGSVEPLRESGIVVLPASPHVASPTLGGLFQLGTYDCDQAWVPHFCAEFSSLSGFYERAVWGPTPGRPALAFSGPSSCAQVAIYSAMRFREPQRQLPWPVAPYAASAWEGNNQVRLALLQHPLISDRASLAAEAFPVGHEDIARNALRLGPFLGQRVGAARPAYDE